MHLKYKYNFIKSNRKLQSPNLLQFYLEFLVLNPLLYLKIVLL